ncbi:hypothetical protein [Candidatus Phyllobacterium onerii]|uniref:hypothetical protein n=1 Tax=Candidatus Phyllobacterium onerii TaxID=3020828 RepID=UPI00232ABA11|nr:hypothetical protein [Phyllobacterium sp. IY22]
MLTHIKRLPPLCSAVVALGLVTVPYKLTLENHSLELHTQSAWAKDGGKGAGGGGANNGNGGGNSGNNGNSGNAGGNSGNAGGKGGNSGNGGDKGSANAGGNSGNSGDGGNSGNNGGRKGDSSGDSGTSGDNGSDSTNTRAGNSGNVQSGKIGPSTPAESVAIDGSAMEVRHWNGMSERIKDGRYVMKDAKGRTIINRTATVSDESRLRSFDR